MVLGAVCRTLKPCDSLLVQSLDILELSSGQEVVLDIPHRVLNLPLALGIRLAVEYDLQTFI